ncbi:alpha-D-ribose 1-methylphosphonate 5-triphosphate diphosphatase [Acidisphaera sp. L21]|uniref:alpha-D-ribose 1-methylphosphonate 5-triphosphate diphosphatase n=1 Tax=Acidisphaera sp. L21 TaxID=1641851 RepID=UPI00131CA5DD|nr:alpha-D-ribose 1-methylphosphonate 5-triphosphate diphosphatase [Acidisphaera sp. L21]
MDLRIDGGQVLIDGALVEGEIGVHDGVIDTPAAARRSIDASGLLVLPGIIDLHGDAFERQIQPRPGVDFPMDLALAETETQLLANGITTAYHGITLSWEPGLRGVATWTALLNALDASWPRRVCDMRVHLRWEAFNLDALDMAIADIAAGRVHLLAFNDHTPAIVRRTADPVTAAKYSDRAGMTVDAFRALTTMVAARATEVPEAQQRIAAAAHAAGLPMASHDDDTLPVRDAFRTLGARICEFPMAEEVARAAVAAGDWVAMGSPNVVRGGSHLGWASAATMAEAGICRILTSDYYYPALSQAPFVLAGRGVLDLATAWALVSTNPAQAAGLTDRGVLAPGKRADIVLVDPGPIPQVVATIANGRIAAATAEAHRRLR